jgi:hypothetical protein
LRILWLDDKCRHNRYDDWLHWKFAKYIRNYADVFFYSPFIHEVEPSFTPIHYDKNKLLKDIVDELKIDCVIMDTKGAAFHNYLPDILYHDKHTGSVYWLPPDFRDCKVLKICIEEDFQYETSDDWHKEHGFSAILQRHYSQYARTKNMSLPKHFFPFSVDPTAFYPRGYQRNNRIGFAGTQGTGNAMSGGQSVYAPRENAYRLLHNHGLLAERTVVIGGERLNGDPYIDYLQRYTAYLCCGSVYHLTPAKMVEIMASGGVLFTDDQTQGLDLMFPNETYLTYKQDASDLLDKVRNIFDDVPFRDAIVNRGVECIKEKHTHDVRIKELFDIIERYR